MHTSSPYAHSVIQVKKLGKHYQVKYLQSVRLADFYETLPYKNFGDPFEPVQLLTDEKSKNDNKLKNNISRALSTCRDIALSNDWEYFITLTLDPSKYDRFDLGKWHKDLSVFIKFYNRKYNCRLRYLLVPERHSNGAWHLHGLIAGLETSSLVTNNYGFLDWRDYSDRFGFCNLGKINNSIAVSFYISKHLGKQIYNGVLELNSHLYYCSHGLSRGELVSLLTVKSLPADFKFQYESLDGSYKSSFFEDDSFLKSINLI